LELFADWTTAGVEAVVLVPCVVVVFELVEEDPPQAAAITAAGTSPRTMPHRA
jgi:hypothetical protein